MIIDDLLGSKPFTHIDELSAADLANFSETFSRFISSDEYNQQNLLHFFTKIKGMSVSQNALELLDACQQALGESDKKALFYTSASMTCAFCWLKGNGLDDDVGSKDRFDVRRLLLLWNHMLNTKHPHNYNDFVKKSNDFDAGDGSGTPGQHDDECHLTVV